MWGIWLNKRLNFPNIKRSATGYWRSRHRFFGISQIIWSTSEYSALLRQNFRAPCTFIRTSHEIEFGLQKPQQQRSRSGVNGVWEQHEWFSRFEVPDMKVCIERVQRSHVAEFEILMQIKQVCHRSYRPALQRPNLPRMTQHIAP